jgi:soluble lytic murein transglycosylase
MPARPFLTLSLFGCLLVLLALGPTRAQAAEVAARVTAVEAFREGRYEDVLLALEASVEPELRYLASRALAELGRYDEALAKLPEPPLAWPVEVRTDIAHERLTWLAESARCSEVQALVGAQADAQITRFLARCAFNSRDFAKVRELLASAKDDAGRGMFARSLYALGERDKAVPLLRDLYVHKPAHPDEAEFLRLLREAESSLKLSSDESLDRAEALISARRLDNALSELDALSLAGDRTREARRQHLRGEAFFRSRHRYPDASRAFAKAAALGGSNEAYDAFHAVRATSRAGQDRDAIKRYRAFAHKYPTSSYAPDAVYLAAWLSARLGLKGAREELARFANSDLGKRQKGLLRDAEWDLGWLAVLSHDAEGANTWLTRYQRDADSELEAARALYWLGRSALFHSKQSRAREHFLAAIDADRHGYYALLSVRQLELMSEPLPAAFAADARLDAPDPSSLTLPPASAFYAALGLHADAARALEQTLNANTPRAERIMLLNAAGDAAKAHSAASPLMQSVLRTSPETAAWAWQALFPRPYAALVARETARQNLPLELFYGHMQVESRYRPEVVSGADAIGLMQLLPSTGGAVAKRLGLPGTRRALKTPYVNVALGAAYLSQLISQFHGQVPLAIAAYNAGGDRVWEWVKRTGHVELERWVEEIPVEQTRNYVRRVITAWARYHVLAVPTEAWRLPLPTHVSPGRD